MLPVEVMEVIDKECTFPRVWVPYIGVVFTESLAVLEGIPETINCRGSPRRWDYPGSPGYGEPPGGRGIPVMTDSGEPPGGGGIPALTHVHVSFSSIRG